MPLVVRPSPINAIGVYTTSAIRKGTRVVEYDGERITPEEADRRYDGASRTYLYGLEDGKTVIDGEGLGAYLNHSCDPIAKSTKSKDGYGFSPSAILAPAKNWCGITTCTTMKTRPRATAVRESVAVPCTRANGWPRCAGVKPARRNGLSRHRWMEGRSLRTMRFLSPGKRMRKTRAKAPDSDGDYLCSGALPCSLHPSMIRYSTGMKNRFNIVDMIMPPKTVVPTEWRPFSPAPVATTSGTTPRMKARDVIRMGRKRIVAACTADSTSGTPRSRNCSANSTIRIAFLLESPTSMTKPTWQKTSFCSPRIHCPPSAPRRAIGTASSTMNGRTKLSYCAESVR